MNKPVEYGGQGLDFKWVPPDLVECCRWNIALAEAIGHIRCGGVPMSIGVQTDLATPALSRWTMAGKLPLFRFGSDELKRKFLAPSIAGDMVACLGISEPGAGSDVATIATSATRDGDDLVINGQKMWITNGFQADWMCMLANTSAGPGNPGHLGIPGQPTGTSPWCASPWTPPASLLPRE